MCQIYYTEKGISPIVCKRKKRAMKRILALLMLFTLLLGMAASAVAEEEAITYTGTITGGSLHLRKEPSPSGKVVDTYKSGTKVDILENDGTWCHVQVGTKTGYMMTQYLDIQPNYTHLGWGKTPGDGTVLNVRASASADAKVVYKAMSSGVFELVAEAGDWYKVRVGEGFGYLPKTGITLLEGDYLPAITATDNDELSPEALRRGPREVGSATTVTREGEDFSYAITYPSLGAGFAWISGEISAWAQNTLRVFQEDHQQNHPGEQATYTVEYESVSLDGDYYSVLLLGRYQVGSLHADTALALNFDGEGNPVSLEQAVEESQLPRVLFCLESAVSALMPAPACGYDGKPGSAWLQTAALGKEGVEVILPEGAYLPAALGSRRLTLGYGQVAECLALQSDYIASRRRVIDPAKPMIALTFDDGPSEETDRILKTLTQYGGRATFCVIGNKIETYGDVIKRTIAQGSEIACHTWSHPHFDRISSSAVKPQIQKVVDAVRELTGGYEIKVLRPPYGTVTAAVRSACRDLDLVIAKWQVDTEDWTYRNANRTYNAVIKGAKNGYIVLCHDIYTTTADAMERAIPELVSRGYQLVTVSELLSFHKDGVEAGKIYIKLDPENIKTE